MKTYTQNRHIHTHKHYSHPCQNQIQQTQAKNGSSLEGEVPSPLNSPSGCKFRTRCKFATEKCAQEVPKMVEIAKGHEVACHLF
ncbi:oligopeptide/dipeptide ABC transporter ATP-binding protein [Bacillus thuringiensis]|uniref:oligopeptide/dipeptide ABC transporter ATP-binding protein n=1 Tax=Bacillus thuringiensis TaxID=1428 RepID=UPI003D1FE95C